MKRFLFDGLLILIILAVFVSFSSSSTSSSDSKSISSFDQAVSNSQTVPDGNLENPEVIKVDNGNFITKITSGIGNGLQKMVDGGMSIIKNMLKSFLN